MPVLETKGAASAQGYGLTTSQPQQVYIEDVFSTWLYTGNGGTQTITNGIDLAGKGGLVWMKSRSVARPHFLFDTARGANLSLSSNSTTATNTWTTALTEFLTNGFSLGSMGETNTNGESYASWTFREQAKFFDVVTYTGNGANRTIAHNLGSVPGCIIVKRTNATADWQVYHRSLANTQYMVLNSTAAAATGATRWNSTTPTDTVFSLGTDATVNASGGTYVAYLFAHDAGGFGATGANNVITCGSYTGNGSTTGPVVTLGYEPQWLLVKRANGSEADWHLIDNMRGFTVLGSVDAVLNPNLASGESATQSFVAPTATGFQINTTSTSYNASGATYIYIAIRRGPMRTPTTGTSVFGLSARAGTNTDVTVTGGQTNDAVLIKNRGNPDQYLFASRLTNRGYMSTASVDPESNAVSTVLQTNPWDVMDGIKVGTTSTITNSSSFNYINYLFRRAPSFFDVVCYTGTGSNRTVAHNLGIAPELMIVRNRFSGADNWAVYSSAIGASNFLTLNQNNGFSSSSTVWNNTAPTASVFTVGTDAITNSNNGSYIAYLFASCPGVSKVGSYTGTAATQVIDCGFAAGARFVLIKRTDSTGDWYVWDAARGIVAGNDPYLLLNSTAAEVTNTDWVDTAASGFELSNAAGNNANINGASYIFLSVA